MGEMILTYDDIKNTIKTELNRVAESFVEIGYQLKQVRDRELYRIDEYNNINEFAKSEYGLSQSTTSRFIAINDAYSVNGSSPKLLDQYDGYGYSKLSEMLTLSEEELKLVTLRTTRAEIREIKQVKKEADTEIYAPAHNAESIDSTQSEGNIKGEIEYTIPEADKLLIEFFRDKLRRDILKQLAAVLSDDISNDIIAKAVEIINPSSHLMFRKGMVILIFEEDHIKYNKFNGPTTQFTYSDLFRDIYLVFDMSSPDPWVAYYGEPEPNPIPEPKPEPKKEQVKDTKPVQTKDKVDNKSKKPTAPTPEEKISPQEDKKTIEGEDIPGKYKIENYLELTPESETESNIRRCRECGCTDNNACEGGCYWVEDDLCSSCADKMRQIDNAELVEADVIMTPAYDDETHIDETIQWHPVTIHPEGNQYVLLAILHNGLPDVVMGHYHTSAFHEEIYNGKGCTYQYWATKPKSPLLQQ